MAMGVMARVNVRAYRFSKFFKSKRRCPWCLKHPEYLQENFRNEKVYNFYLSRNPPHKPLRNWSYDARVNDSEFQCPNCMSVLAFNKQDAYNFLAGKKLTANHSKYLKNFRRRS